MNVISWLYDLLYGSEPREFPSEYSIGESVSRLQGASVRWVIQSLFAESAVGAVSASNVRLQRVIPLVGNSFKPFFMGKFEERDGKVYLVGKFTMLRLTKLFMSFWLGGVLLACVLFPFAPTPGYSLFKIIPFGMFILGLAMVRLGKWFSRNDPAWLSHVIEGALCDGSRVVLPTARPSFWASHWKWMIPAMILPFAVGLVVAQFAHLEQNLTVTPEFQAAENFLRTSVSIRKEFGEPSKISFNHTFSQSTAFEEPKKSNGRIGFDIQGDKGPGSVTVFWTYNPVSREFVVTRLVRTAPLERSGDLLPK